MRKTVPGHLELGQVGLGESLCCGVNLLELALSGGGAGPGKRVLVLSACAFVEPACLPLGPVSCGCPDRA